MGCKCKCCKRAYDSSNSWDDVEMIEAVNPVVSESMARFIGTVFSWFDNSKVTFNDVRCALRDRASSTSKAFFSVRQLATKNACSFAFSSGLRVLAMRAAEALELWAAFGRCFRYDLQHSLWYSRDNADVNHYMEEKAIFQAECREAEWESKLRDLYDEIIDAIHDVRFCRAMQAFVRTVA